MRQGAILSPLLYSVFVNDLLDQLSASGLGISIDDVYCGAPMYADDLSLIATSEHELQSMLDIVSSYAAMWQYQLNAHKSSILVFGETAVSRKKNRTVRKWMVDGETVPESDSQKNLGILYTVFSSSVHRTVERCSAGRSAFYALNGVGSRFGCLHPNTSLKLYLTLCIPILLYGCELWSLTGCELTMIERVHRKILRTIQGLPLRCHSRALLHLMGVPSISSLIQQRQLNFVHTFSGLPADSLPKLVMMKRNYYSPKKGSLPVFYGLFESHNLPSLPEIVNGDWGRLAWKRWMKGLFRSSEYLAFLDECDHLPLSDCVFPLGKPILHWSVTHGLPLLTRKNNFRIRLLVGCDGLEADAGRFRYRTFTGVSPAQSTCRLCKQEREDVSHFLAHCPTLDHSRRRLLQTTPSSPVDLRYLYFSDSARFVNLILGIEWITDADFQRAIIVFLDNLRRQRIALLTQES